MTGPLRVRAAERPTSLRIVGHPVAQSLSPGIQSAALAAAGLPVEYGRLDVPPEGLAEALRELARSASGGNVTMPHKQAVFAATQNVSALAQRVGAVNTFWHADGALCGHNTDVAGVLASVHALCPTGLRERRVALLGAGGSAAAVLVALELAGCTDIRVWSRQGTRAEELAERVGVRVVVATSVDVAIDDAALVINATPLGMSSDDMPVPVERLAPSAAVFDLVYRPNETAWVRDARARGHAAEDGLRMLVEQGAESFRVWFDVEPSLAAMWATLPRTAPDHSERAR